MITDTVSRTKKNLLIANLSRLALAFCAFLVLDGSIAKAEQSSVQQRLSKAIEQARSELESERQRIQREERSQEEQLQKVIAQSNSLSDEIVERTISIAQKEERLKKLRDERAELQQKQSLLEQEMKNIGIIASDAEQKLSDLLDTLPPSESRLRQRQLLSDFRASIKKNEQDYIDISKLLELISLLLDESRTTNIFKQKIRNSEGYQEEVEVLRIGQIFFAYKSLSSDNVGLAVSAPDDGAGFRWTKRLPAWAGKSISKAIDKAKQKSGIYFLPIDVTQQLASQRYSGSDGLWERMVSGGPVMVPLGVVAALALILIIERFVFFSRQKGYVDIAEDILAACHAGNYKKAEQIAVQKPCIASRALLACLTRRLENIAVMEDAIQEAILHELPRLERFLPSIGILAAVAPLLGLLGTVTGMISTFDMITVFGSGQPRLMAGGISEALVTTATGLVIAIPILLVHSFLSSRADGLIADTERFAATLLNLLKERSDKD